MQTKTALWFHPTHWNRRMFYKWPYNWPRSGGTGTPPRGCPRGCGTVQPLWKAIGQFLTKLNIYVAAIWPRHSTPLYFLKGNQNICSRKGMCMHVHGSFIPKCPKVGTAQISINKWMSKQITIHPHNWNATWPQKGTKDWYMQHGWIAKSLCWGKKLQKKRSTCYMLPVT